MADILDRLEKLMAMAGSPVQEEARTAALMAVTLMKKHGIRLSLPDDAPAPRARQKPRAPEVVAHAKTAKVDGFCKQCGGVYFRGDSVWVGRSGVTHAQCDLYWRE